MTYPEQGVVTNSYDSQDRVLTQTDPMTRLLEFDYRTCGAHCKGTTVTDNLGYATVYTYDGNRLVNLVANPGPQEARWIYDYSANYPTGISRVVDPNQHEWTYDWDSNGNLLSATDPLTHTTRYEYSAVNDLGFPRKSGHEQYLTNS
jgi:YD repeat-containing protein